jgi:hypothetical protein
MLLEFCLVYDSMLNKTTVNQVKKIVEGSFQSFQSMYRPLLQEYIAEGLLKRSSHGQQKTFHQVYYLSAHTHSLLPCSKRKL